MFRQTLEGVHGTQKVKNARSKPSLGLISISLWIWRRASPFSQPCLIVFLFAAVYKRICRSYFLYGRVANIVWQHKYIWTVIFTALTKRIYRSFWSNSWRCFIAVTLVPLFYLPSKMALLHSGRPDPYYKIWQASEIFRFETWPGLFQKATGKKRNQWHEIFVFRAA